MRSDEVTNQSRFLSIKTSMSIQSINHFVNPPLPPVKNMKKMGIGKI